MGGGGAGFGFWVEFCASVECCWVCHWGGEVPVVSSLLVIAKGRPSSLYSYEAFCCITHLMTKCFYRHQRWNFSRELERQKTLQKFGRKVLIMVCKFRVENGMGYGRSSYDRDFWCRCKGEEKWMNDYKTWGNILSGEFYVLWDQGWVTCFYVDPSPSWRIW